MGPRVRGGVAAAAVASLAALLAAAALALAPAARAERPPPMCEREYAVDYAAPLAAMPQPAPPPEGELPFGPHNFGIHRVDGTQVVLERRLLGYRFAGKNDGARVLDLRWRARATLRRVDARGRVKRTVGVRRWRVRKVKHLDRLQLAFPAKHSGFFRIDLRIRRLDGHLLGSYRDYFRVLKRTVDVAIGLSATAVHRGESIYAQLEDRGASRLNAPGFLRLEREEAGSWVEVPQPASPASVFGIGWLIDSGQLLDCQRYDVPPDAPPGRYRFAVDVNVANLQERLTYVGEFEVLP